MRTITLLVASLLLTANVTKAQENRSFPINTTTVRPNLNEPISFIERGIEFFVFQNGDFDFNTRTQGTQGGFYYKGAGKREIDASLDRGTRNNGVIIERDDFGRIKRVGSTFINYDYRGRVSRIGFVFLTYNRFALTQVGGLHLVYNRFGELVDMIGSVTRNYDYAYNESHNYNNGYNNCNYNDNNYHNNYGNYSYNHDDHYQTSNYNSNDYYYYKTDGTREKVENSKEENR